MRLSSARMGRIRTGAPSGRRSITPLFLVRWLPNCVKCVTLVVEFRVNAQAVEDVVRVFEVARVDDRGRQTRGRAERRDRIEVERERAGGRQLHRAAALPDRCGANLAVEAAQSLGA